MGQNADFNGFKRAVSGSMVWTRRNPKTEPILFIYFIINYYQHLSSSPAILSFSINIVCLLERNMEQRTME
jgi:hypothetical protein